jgi:hypothetical protein
MPSMPIPIKHTNWKGQSGMIMLSVRRPSIIVRSAPGQPYQRVLQIKKMRYNPVTPAEYPFAMMPNAGIVLVNVNPAFRSHELSFVLKRSRMKAIFLHERDRRTDYHRFSSIL